MTVEAAIQADLDALLLPWQDVSARRMFGGNGYFVGDRLFAVFHKGVVAAKLPDPERTQVLDGHIARPFSPTPGRPFGEWVEFIAGDDNGVNALLPWLSTAFEYVQRTPPKGKRAAGRAR